MAEKIITTEYSEEMQRSYMNYSMSVITARAIPDARDGLKPVQRRVLYDMSELKLGHDKPHRKSARIVGDTMGKYHPHGDSSIYDTLVVMSQNFKKGMALIDGHGNFGSIEGDGAAAMRYTEARLEKFAEEVYLKDLDKTVDFVPNYDETEKEPEVLPVRVPNLLINGAEGIAVGMSTSIPPHNLGEVVDAVKAYIQNPDITTEELMRYMPGPDFPTGGIIANKKDLPAIYETGAGKIKLRGRIEVELGKRRSDKDKLVITEIPYTMVGAGINKFLMDVADLVETRKLTDVVDSASIAQVQELCNQEFTAGSRIRLMPDIHAGAGCTIGTTMTITDKVVPNLVGVDIGCGMETTRIREGRLELQKLDKLIYEKIPSGFSIRDKAHRYLNEIDLSELCCARHVDLLRAEKSIGTLGGGNHFIEVDKDDEGNLYIVVHSGSRHLGVEVASYYQEAGYKVLNRTDDASIEALIARMKAEGREKEIQKELKKLKNLKQTNIPKALAYVSGELFEQYIHDMKIVQHFAMLNRQAMMDEIVKGMKLHVEEQFTTIHNYIDTDAMILRKGAVSAKEGERLLIPINMRDGSLLCVGKGNEDWNCSAPHGAGRLMSRADAKQSFTVSEFKKQMAEVYTTSVSKATLDECPMAYKGMQDILDNIGPTADVVKVIRPIYNFKAGDEE